MAESIPRLIPKSTPEIIEQIETLTRQSRRNESETARLNIELGALFVQLKSRAAGTWEAKLKRLGYSPRVARRLMKAATTLAAPDGTVSPQLLERLPGDPIKLETLCALPLPDVQRLINAHDCRQLDRAEVVALVRAQQGKKAAGEKKPATPAEAIRQGWAKSVESLLNKLGKIEAVERDDLIRFLDDSLEDLKEMLHEGKDAVEDDTEQEEEVPADKNGDTEEEEEEPADEPAGEDEEQPDLAEEEVEEEPEEPPAKPEPPRPIPQKPAGAKSAGGRQRARPVNA